MTPDELLQAKIAEVRRRADSDPTDHWLDRRIAHAFDVQAEGWTQPVDPDLLLAREIGLWKAVYFVHTGEIDLIKAGKGDGSPYVTEPLAIIRAHRAHRAKQAGSAA